MHGYDVGMAQMQQNQQPCGPMDMGGHHPDSTDSYVTYLESDDSMQGSP